MARKIIFDFPIEDKRQSWFARQRRTPHFLAAAAILVTSTVVSLAVFNSTSSRPGEAATTTGSEAPKSDSSQEDQITVADLSRNQSQTESTVVHNGVTIISPRLMVPTIAGDDLTLPASGGAAMETKTGKGRTAKTRIARRRIRTKPLTAPWFYNTRQTAGL